MIAREDRCSKDIHYDGRSVSFHQCSRRAVVTRNGKRFCNQHDPFKVAERDVARQARWDKEWKAKEKKWAAQRAAWSAVDLLEYLLKFNKLEGTCKTKAERIVKVANPK